jgi:hypothetical protein
VNINPIGVVPNFKSNQQNRETPSMKRRNAIFTTGQLALCGFCATGVTGLAHMEKAHIGSSLFTALAVVGHIISLRPPKKTAKVNCVA